MGKATTKTKPRIFILTSFSVNDIEGAIKSACEELGIDAEITLSKEKELKRIPRGFDTYLLHISDLFDISADFRQLKEEQPWSRFVGLSSCVAYVGSHMQSFWDQMTSYELLFRTNYAKRIVRDAQANYTRGE